MRLICVGGVGSSCGKTSVVELLLTALPGWAAIKVTPSRPEEACPIGTCCGACQPPEGPYEVLTDPVVLAEPGKDTARYLAAGATEVAWLRALPEALPTALEVAIAAFSDPPGVIVESTTLLPVVSGLRILVAPPIMANIKESAMRCAGEIDLLTVNCFGLEVPSEHPLLGALAIPLSLPIRATAGLDHPGNAAFVSFCTDRAG